MGAKYGEPWVPCDIGNDSNDTLYHVHSFIRGGEDGDNILMGSWLDKDSPVLVRACQCVNACAGLDMAEVPAGAVGELVKRARFLTEHLFSETCTFDGVQELRAALAPFVKE